MLKKFSYGVAEINMVNKNLINITELYYYLIKFALN